MPDSLGFGSRQRPEHPRPASYPTPEQPATRRMRSPFPASNEVPAKQIASKHPTPPLSSGPLPAPPPRPPAIRSQQSVPSGNSRQLPAHAFTSRARNTHKLPQAPLPPSERPAILRVPSSLPSTGQSSERAPSFPRQTLARIAAPTHPPPRNPEHLPVSRNPQIPPGIPTPRFPAPASRNTKKTEPALRRLRSKLFTGIYSIVPISV